MPSVFTHYFKFCLNFVLICLSFRGSNSGEMMMKMMMKEDGEEEEGVK